MPKLWWFWHGRVNSHQHANMFWLIIEGSPVGNQSQLSLRGGRTMVMLSERSYFTINSIFQPQHWDLGLHSSLLWETVPCIIGRLAESLASLYWLPAVLPPSPPRTTKNVSTCPLGGCKITPVENYWPKRWHKFSLCDMDEGSAYEEYPTIHENQQRFSKKSHFPNNNK